VAWAGDDVEAGIAKRRRSGVWDTVRLIFKEDGPGFCQFALTNACNANCGFCNFAREKLPKSDWQSLARQGAFDAIEILARHGIRHLVLTGGEPTLHPDLTAIIRRAAERMMKVMLVTNGGLLKPHRIQEFAAAGLSSFVISVDAASADAHERIGGSIRPTAERNRTGARPWHHRAGLQTGHCPKLPPIEVTRPRRLDLGPSAKRGPAACRPREPGSGCRCIRLMGVDVIEAKPRFARRSAVSFEQLLHDLDLDHRQTGAKATRALFSLGSDGHRRVSVSHRGLPRAPVLQPENCARRVRDARVRGRQAGISWTWTSWAEWAARVSSAAFSWAASRTLTHNSNPPRANCSCTRLA